MEQTLQLLCSQHRFLGEPTTSLSFFAVVLVRFYRKRFKLLDNKEFHLISGWRVLLLDLDHSQLLLVTIRRVVLAHSVPPGFDQIKSDLRISTKLTNMSIIDWICPLIQMSPIKWQANGGRVAKKRNGGFCVLQQRHLRTTTEDHYWRPLHKITTDYPGGEAV